MVGVENLNAIVKTFLRDEHMMKCVESIERHYPEIQIVLVDDGYSSSQKDKFYQNMRAHGHLVEDKSLAFDSGFGAKANLAAALCTRPYVLTTNDDFLFNGNTDGVREMLELLEGLPTVGLVCGTWRNQDYQGWLKRTHENGFNRITEIPFCKDDGMAYDMYHEIPYKIMDLCAVYGIFDRRVFSLSNVRWDARYKIGGEHGDWFMDIKDAGYEIAFTPEANIDEVRATPHPDYERFRLRQGWKEVYTKKHGPLIYTYFNGVEEKFV
jgi:GT2 family glycosyltransferase